MTDCRQISERMPEVARGGVPWSVDQERHIAGCEACRLEWALVRQTARLGVSKLNETLNETKIADVVLYRLRTTHPEVPHRRAWLFTGIAAAAGVVLLLWGKTAPESRSAAITPPESVRESVIATAPSPMPQLELPVPELEDLSADEFPKVMESLDRPFRADELLESPSSGDLESRAFERGFNISEG